MKHLKKLTREQKRVISSNGLDSTKFFCERDTSTVFIFINKETGDRYEFRK